MLRASRSLIFLCAVFCSTNLVSPAQTQNFNAASLDELRLEVKRLEAIDRTTQTLAARGTDSRSLLQNRRARLIKAIEARIESLGRYLPLLKTSSGKDDKQVVGEAIKELRAEARALRERSRKDATWWRCRVPRVAPSAASGRIARGRRQISTQSTTRKSTRR